MASDQDGQTALYCAVRNGHESVAHLLLNEGANPASSTRTGYTVLHCAAANGLENVFCRLLEKGANPAAADETGWAVLHSAASSHHDSMLAITLALLDAGVDASAIDRQDNWTAMHYASQCKRGIALQVVQAIHSHHGAVDAASSTGSTPLHEAAESGRIEVVQYLLRSGANSNAWSLKGTPLHLAVEAMDARKIMALI